MSDLPEFGRELNSPVVPQNMDEFNAIRQSAWRSILLATASCAAVAIVYIFSQSLVWTGGLLLAVGWIWRSSQALREANQEIVFEEKRTGLALKQPLPSWMTGSLVLGIPLTLVLGASALNTYDPYLFGGNAGSNYSSTDNTGLYSPEPEENTLYSPAPVETSDPASTSGGSSSSNGDDLYPSIVRTVDLTDAELQDSTFEWAIGVDVWVPEVCNELTVYWHTEDDFGNYYNDYYNWYQDLELGQVNELYMGTDDSLTDDEQLFVTDRAECT